MKTVEFTAKDGKKLSVKVWEAENPKMLLQISHGMVEHAGVTTLLRDTFRKTE